jgi:hypothetical protein
MAFYFEIIENIPFLTRKMQKIKFCSSFQFYFLRLFLVGENLLFQYEQLLIWMHIGGSPLVSCRHNRLTPKVL